MTNLPVSVVIVSRGRPEALKRALVAVSQLQYDPFEVVVVADPGGLVAVDTLCFAGALKLIPFDMPNISAARNLGLTHAAGEIIAFLDDDAVPEPQWLRHLTAPAERAEVAAMAGFVRGRNGITFQWRAASLDEHGQAHPLRISDTLATVLTPPKGRAIKTEGTNMAFRRDVLISLGGFDPAFHYFLDETDLNMRLARQGYATALVPLAEVHHGFAENRTRRQNRVPRDLFDIGASWAVFQRKHIPPAQHAPHWNGLRHAERRRLLGHMVNGGLEPRDVRSLMRRLEQGYGEGRERTFGTPQIAAHPTAPFARFPALRRKSIQISTRFLRVKKARHKAMQRVRAGEIVTLLILSPTALFHRVWFEAAGLWVQRGGLFGKSERSDPLVRLTSRARRAVRERTRVLQQRGFEPD